jgi:hypothetical protein
MTDYPIQPALRLRLGANRTLGSIDQAAEFVRGHAKDHADREWQGVLYRLESASTKEEAVDAVNALKALLERSNLLITGEE